MALIYNATFDSTTRVLSLLDKAGNVISSCEVPSKELVDDPNKPLMLRSLKNASTVKLIKNGTLSNTYQISKNGEDWTDYTFGNEFILNNGDVVYFRCSNHPTTQTSSNYVQFAMSGEIEAWHNAYSMISSSFTDTSARVGDYGMVRLFMDCSSLTKAPLLLNALSQGCYQAMFYGCTSLTQAPSLPATTLAGSCYNSMFSRCSSLIQAPSLPATTLAVDCYYFMFSECSKLKEVRIAATTTATYALGAWLSGVSATGDFYCDPNATIFPTDSTAGIPKGWTRRDINLLNALTLTATADNSSVKLTKNGTLDNTFEVDTGNGWTAYEFGTVINLNAGQSCKWRCKSHPTTQTDSRYVQFVMTGKIEASGDCNSMLSSDFKNITSLSGYDGAFRSLFSGCSSLTQAPALPATTLANLCYYYMFEGCSSLTQAPALPATALANFCYSNMFEGCSSLTQAPALPATALANFCYSNMFYRCSSLEQAPALPATTLAISCYRSMFYGCSALTEVRISATSTTVYSLDNWLEGVSSTGDFYCDPNATIFPTGVSGIPENWNRHALADYPVTP